MKSDIPFIDFHTHSELQCGKVIEVISLDGNKLKSASFYTIGFHPWWIEGPLLAENLLLISKRYKEDKNCLGIGECGLDNLKGVNIDIQEFAFLQQVHEANKLNAPIIIHCVRAFDRILKMKRQYCKTPWVVHGFLRNKDLAKQLIDAGFYISVAPSHHMTNSFIEALKYLPGDRIFIETDSDFQLDIKARYEIYCDLNNLATEDVKEQIFINFNNFFSQKWKYRNG